MQLKDQEAFETSSLIGHSARVYALYYKDGLLCTGTHLPPPVADPSSACVGLRELLFSQTVLKHERQVYCDGLKEPESRLVPGPVGFHQEHA